MGNWIIKKGASKTLLRRKKMMLNYALALMRKTYEKRRIETKSINHGHFVYAAGEDASLWMISLDHSSAIAP